MMLEETAQALNVSTETVKRALAAGIERQKKNDAALAGTASDDVDARGCPMRPSSCCKS